MTEKELLAPFFPHLDPASVHFAMPELVRNLAGLGVRRVVLYGSRARGDHMPRADIDLALDWPGHGPDDWSRAKEVIDEARTLLEIDFVFLDEATGDFLRNILRDGKVLHDEG